MLWLLSVIHDEVAPIWQIDGVSSRTHPTAAQSLDLVCTSQELYVLGHHGTNFILSRKALWVKILAQGLLVSVCS